MTQLNGPSRGAPQHVALTVEGLTLHGVVRVPPDAGGVVLFAHGSGSGRLSPRNNYVAEHLGAAGFATLLFDLLTEEEEKVDAVTAELRFDIPLLTNRLIAATRWVEEQPQLRDLALGYFGASTGAAAALAAASRVPTVAAVVSRGGRPDLAGAALPHVRAATLLIVGGNDPQVLKLNRSALQQLTCRADLQVVAGASHLFVEPGTLERVASLAADWFTSNCATSRRSSRR
jgi:dienelactone hydrolase